MIPCVIIWFFTSMTKPFSGKKGRHTSDNVIMVIMQKQINPFLFFRPRINNRILMVFGNNVDLILGQMGLKLLDLI